MRSILKKLWILLNFKEYLEQNDDRGKTAAGVAILYQNKILLIHPTNSSWKKGTCGIPKGHVEPGEDVMHAALRELFEETGISLRPEQLDPNPRTVDVLSKKGAWQLIYFVCEIKDLSEVGLSSESIPKKQLQLKEVDWAKFVSAKEAYPITSRNQLILLDRHLTL